MKTVKCLPASLFLAALVLAGTAAAQIDPGVQGGFRGTGLPLGSVANDAGLTAFFEDGLDRFQDVERVSDPSNMAVGLGPRFNFNQCAGCHATPAVGGTGAAVNPQFAAFGPCDSIDELSLDTTKVAAGQPTAPQAPKTIVCNNTNARPFFITMDGPTREARFPFFFNPDGTPNLNNPNGGVETLFTVKGRPDGAQGCDLAQPPFVEAANVNNLIFRIPTPVFGAGLIENVDDSTLLQNRNANLNNNFGIGGDFNHNGNDNTIARFGWKAQNKSLHIFSGEAYNVEMGISNLLFGQDRPLPEEDGNGGSSGAGFPASCLNLAGTGYPEDVNNPNATAPPGSTVQAAALDDVSAFANFMRLLAPPPPGPVILNGVQVSQASIDNGRVLFSVIGCATCHNPTVGNTQPSNITADLGNAPVNAFSDIEIHHMGPVLNDNVAQGGAGGDQFRTAPLWGLGQRVFLLHDGRCPDLLCAIEAHDSNGSEAQISEMNFDIHLTQDQQQDLLNFLRSL